MRSISSTSVTKLPAQRPITPPPVAAADAEPPAPTPAKAMWHGVYSRVRNMLAKRYPVIFSCARPLKVGIDRDLRAAIPEDELSNAALQHFLYKWVRRAPYRAALARGVRRVDLDGNDAGPANVNDGANRG